MMPGYMYVRERPRHSKNSVRRCTAEAEKRKSLSFRRVLSLVSRIVCRRLADGGKKKKRKRSKGRLMAKGLKKEENGGEVDAQGVATGKEGEGDQRNDRKKIPDQGHGMSEEWPELTRASRSSCVPPS